jgi:hypothetical protein
VSIVHSLEGKESGINVLHLASLQTANTFIDPELSARVLGYDVGGLDEAFQKTVQACKR